MAASLAGTANMAAPGIPWPEIAGGLLSGSLLTHAFAWWNGRKKRDGERNAYVMGAVDHAVELALNSVTGRLEKVEAQHKQCEFDLAAVREDLADAKSEIARMMKGPIAPYEVKP